MKNRSSSYNLHMGHRQKVKEKFIESGFPKGTPPHEILELILFYSIPRKDTNEIAHELVNKFGSLAGVFNATEQELVSVKGVTENTVVLLKLILASARAYNADLSDKASVFMSVEELGTYLIGRYAGVTEEKFSVISLNNYGKMLSMDVVSIGDISTVGVSTRKVIEVLIRTKATAVVLAHNHPGGVALPSDADLTVTKMLGDAMRHIGVHLVDHIIIADGDFVSLAQTEKFRKYFE